MTWEASSGRLQSALRSGRFSGAALAVGSRSHHRAASMGLRAFEEFTDGRDPEVTPDTLFDLASVTKVVVALAVLSAIDEGTLRLHQRAADFLPAFDDPGRSEISLFDLLTHTSGLPGQYPPTEWTTDAPSIEDVLSLSSVGPGRVHRYSCLGFIALGVILERSHGTELSDVLRARVLDPLHMFTTSFGPIPRGRSAATEMDVSRLDRGLIWGEVHDELAWQLGGKVGNAGLFASIGDAAKLGQELLRVGLGQPTLFANELAERMSRRQTTLPVEGRYAQGFGVRIGDDSFMGLRTDSIGHAGFTGTGVVADPATDQFVVLLTNRVHPTRGRRDIGDVLSEICDITFESKERR